MYTNNLQTFWQPYPVDAEDFSKANAYMTSLLTPENYMASQDKLGDILKLNFKDIGCKSIKWFAVVLE